MSLSLLNTGIIDLDYLYGTWIFTMLKVKNAEVINSLDIEITIKQNNKVILKIGKRFWNFASELKRITSNSFRLSIPEENLTIDMKLSSLTRGSAKTREVDYAIEKAVP